MLEPIEQQVVAGAADAATSLVEAAPAAGADPQAITDEALTAGPRTVGELFDRGSTSSPRCRSADAMEQAMVALTPLLATCGRVGTGTVVMGTLQGDLHDIGENLVITMLEGAGFDVVDLGIDVCVPRYLRAVREHDAHIVGIGALITTVLPAVERA